MNKMEYPYFTVVIPTYNRAKLLKEAIQSVCNQTFTNFEVIVVDDHSTDNTKVVVNSFQDTRIKYVLNDLSTGGAGTRNAGIFRSCGKWVAFLDDDDVWLKEKLELQHKKIQVCDDMVGLIYCGRASYDFEKKQEILLYVPQKRGWIQNDLLYKNYIGTYSTVVIKADLLKKLYGLDERFMGMQDMELYVRIAGIAKVEFLKEKLVHVRQSNNDKISYNPQKKLESSILFWQKYNYLINKNCRLKHRAASRVFINAFDYKDRKYMFKVFFWIVLGLLFDIKNVFWVLRYVTSSIYRNKILVKPN